MADEFLTQELPAIRRAQERSLVALDSLVRLVEWALWRHWRAEDEYPMVIARKGKINALGANPRRLPTTSLGRSQLILATFAVCLDAVHGISEARGLLPLPEAEVVRAKAITLQERMLTNFNAVSSKLTSTESRAFGANDPLTASWLLPILRQGALPGVGAGSRPERFKPEFGRVSLVANVEAGIERLLSPDRLMIIGGAGDRENRAKEHAWPASLAVRALNLVTRGDPKWVLEPTQAEALQGWAEQQVRLQLARSVTGEAGQDAAHLAAALAVAMWLEELPLPLLEAAVEQLCAMQRPDGSLLLTRPYLADQEGSAITPHAADATLAMIAVADQLDARYPEHPTVLRIQQQLLEAVQRQREAYFRSSMRKGEAGGETLMVWSSANARATPEDCDTWATARTVTALVMTLNLECRLITRRLLEESRFSYRAGGDIEQGFHKLVDPQLQSEQSRPTVVATLRRGLTESDPDPKQEKTRAVLLCGPPGTSKTSLIEAVTRELAEDLAEKQLARYVVHLVQLSPADFLLDGPNRVEQRAKRIFDYLTQMENVVVLFDEIDRLILDRASPEYDKQGDVFQFMTPSMLPKLTALRERGSVLRFAIATNYAERIDPAIARKGRIDRAFVIPPPNLNARLRILEDLPRQAAERLALVTPLWVYGDLRALRRTAKQRDIMAQSPSGSLASYKSRRSTARKDVLANEILQLAELYLEGRGPEVLKARGAEEIGAIAWASENASPAIKKKAGMLIDQLKKAGVGPFVSWDSEKEEEDWTLHVTESEPVLPDLRQLGD